MTSQKNRYAGLNAQGLTRRIEGLQCLRAVAHHIAVQLYAIAIGVEDGHAPPHVVNPTS